MDQSVHALQSQKVENSNNDFENPPMRLKGGGESSGSNGTTAWNSQVCQPSSNNNATKMSTNQPQQSSSDNTAWPQIGSKAQSNETPASTNQSNASQVNNNGPLNTTKQQLEQLQSLREAIFSQDGWGGQYVSQDTSWDMPPSPESQNKTDGTKSSSSSWKPTVNNGTELWEANLKNGGQPPPQPQQKTPWGHTPSNNIGGTWGEDDDTDSSNILASNPSQNNWTGTKKENEWNSGANVNWQNPRTVEHQPIAVDPRTPVIRGANNSEPGRLLENTEPMRQISSDTRGITGRLNGAGGSTYWAQPNQTAQPMPHHKISGPTNAGGWEDPTLNLAKRPIPNCDDGTSIWNNNSQVGSQWKDLPPVNNIGRNNPSVGLFGNSQQSRMKADPSTWGNNRNNGSWDEINNQSSIWDDSNSWNKQRMTNPSWNNEGEWNKKSNRLLTKDMIWSSKQFRMLVDMGHKKEDVENVLRAREMNMDEALEILNSMRRLNGWEQRRDHYDFLHYNNNQKYHAGANMPSPNFPPHTNEANLLNTLSNTLINNNQLPNNVSSAYAQKMFMQGNVPQGGPARNFSAQPQPTTQQLKMLVGQIQMAVQAGFLNNQILNQPLAPQTLALLNQLLQQIKTLQQLYAQQSILSNYGVNGKQNNAYLQYSLHIAKTKYAIENLQNQIANQQNNYVKQQMGDLAKTNLITESINSLQGNFTDLDINKEQQSMNQQSKLNQWIKGKNDNEFSRAPGSTSKIMSNGSFGLMPAEGPWSTAIKDDTSGWPDGTTDGGNEKVEPSQWSSNTHPSIPDLVPEFEPGKPWKGTQMKSVEDDPSITPGSVVRSPLSIPSITDAKLFNISSNKSPPLLDMQEFGLNSPTWNNPRSRVFPSSFEKMQNVNGDIIDSITTPSTDLWNVSKQSKGPPGFANNNNNNWSNNMSSSSWVGSNRNSGNWSASTWLLLKNLTTQIDGSTLRTLCMQHGPLLTFNLYLYMGLALAKYATREEAVKAQNTLNNCVLGNTTILAENPSDLEANMLIQQLASQQKTSSDNCRESSNKPISADSWNTNWSSNSSSANLWSNALDCGDMRSTPSNINSFLPNDLLGGETV